MYAPKGSPRARATQPFGISSTRISRVATIDQVDEIADSNVWKPRLNEVMSTRVVSSPAYHVHGCQASDSLLIRLSDIVVKVGESLDR